LLNGTHSPRTAVWPAAGSKALSLSLSFMVFDELFEVFDAVACERRRRPIAGAPNGEASVFRLHLRCEVLQPLFILAEHFGHTADGEDGTWRCHDQAA
ncbi:MAG TPA: hypothetical protein VE251_04830, partial [Xanthobacteraceae bacterium]|nr:hypothetical protein [Xanthobacteraceae bacterium]